MKYFDVTWADSEAQMDEQARVFGPLLAWAINKNLISDHHRDLSRGVMERVYRRSADTPQFFADLCFDLCDGKICDQDFNDAGNAFMRHYIQADFQLFADDFYGTLGENLPRDDSWEMYDKLVPVFDRRFAEWCRAES